MTTAIKPGQTWARKGLPTERLHVDLVRPAHVEFKFAGSIMHVLTIEEFLDTFELVEDAPALPTHDGKPVQANAHLYTDEPAPLDPSPEIIDAVNVLRDAGIRSAEDFDRLVAHQPAPEPEPEWKPGKAGTATLNNLVDGNAALGMRAMRVTHADGSGSFVFENGTWIGDDATTWSVSDFVPDESRPLPTPAQVMGALDTAFKATGNTGWGHWLEPGTKAVMSLLRGESW